MKKTFCLFLLTLFCLCSYSQGGLGASTAKSAVSINLSETAIFGFGSLMFDYSTLIPVLVNVDIAGKEKLGFTSSLQYRHHQDGSNLKFNEFAFLAGPRYNPSGSGLNKFHLSPKVGMALAGGRNYYDEEALRFLIIFQPEFGYSACLLDNKLFVDFGLGVQLRHALLDHPSSIQWNAFGRLIDYWVPQVNLSIGYCLPSGK